MTALTGLCLGIFAVGLCGLVDGLLGDKSIEKVKIVLSIGYPTMNTLNPTVTRVDVVEDLVNVLVEIHAKNQPRLYVHFATYALEVCESVTGCASVLD